MDFKLSRIYATFVHALQIQIQEAEESRRRKKEYGCLKTRLAACEKRMIVLRAWQSSRTKDRTHGLTLTMQEQTSPSDTKLSGEETKRVRNVLNDVRERIVEYASRQSDADKSSEELDRLGKLVALSQSKDASDMRYEEVVDQWQDEFDKRAEETAQILTRLSERVQALMLEVGRMAKDVRLVSDNLADRAESVGSLANLVVRQESIVNDSQQKRRGLFARLFGGH